MARFLLELCLLTLLFHTGFGEYKRVCYFTNWAQYRSGVGKFQPSDIDPSLCTHIIYAFGKLAGNTMQSLEWNDYQLYEQINKTKQENPSLKTLLAMGGWTAGSVVYSNMVSTAESRAEFIESSINYLRIHGFDGLDMDWEYPANRGGLLSDKQNFGLLVKELREAFEQEANKTGLSRLLLTAAVAAGKFTIDTAYDVPTMAEYMDFINIMSYDLHGSWDRTTGHNSPLFPRSSEYGSYRYLNIEYAANYWHTLGVPKNKLIIGLATYGRSFTLSGSVTGMGAAASGAGVRGQYTREAGFLSYYEICTRQESGIGWTVYDSEQKVPYYTDGSLWVGFDDVISLAIKTKWLITEGYGGAMVWSFDLDDFNKVCTSSKRKFPLMNTIKDLILAADNGETLTTPALPTGISSAVPPPSTTPGSTTEGISNPGGDFSCDGKVGTHTDPSDCSKFYICEGGTAFQMSCPGGLLFNSGKKYCDYPANVVCITQSSSSTTISTTSTVSSTTSSTSATPTFSSSRTSSTSTHSQTLSTSPSLSSKLTTSFTSTTSSTSTSSLASTSSQTTLGASSTATATRATTPTSSSLTSTLSQTTSAARLSTTDKEPSTATRASTTKATIVPTITQTTNSIPASDFCEDKAQGFFSDTFNCNNFYYCYGYGAVILSCPTGQYFNPMITSCDHSRNVDCNNGYTITDDSDKPTTTSTVPGSTTRSTTRSPTSEQTTQSSSTSKSSTLSSTSFKSTNPSTSQTTSTSSTTSTVSKPSSTHFGSTKPSSITQPTAPSSSTSGPRQTSSTIQSIPSGITSKQPTQSSSTTQSTMPSSTTPSTTLLFTTFKSSIMPSSSSLQSTTPPSTPSQSTTPSSSTSQSTTPSSTTSRSTQSSNKTTSQSTTSSGATTKLPVSSSTSLTSTNPLNATPLTNEFCSHRPNGDYAHPSDCSKFVTCIGSMQYVRGCPLPLLWNPANGNCDWKRNVKCHS